jgi:hypothetical protein
VIGGVQGRHLDSECLLSEFVGDVQKLLGAQVARLIELKAKQPDLIRVRGTKALRRLVRITHVMSFGLCHANPLEAGKALDPLVVHAKTLSSKVRRWAPIAMEWTRLGEIANAGTSRHLKVGWRQRRSTPGRPRMAN